MNVPKNRKQVSYTRNCINLFIHETLKSPKLYNQSNIAIGNQFECPKEQETSESHKKLHKFVYPRNQETIKGTERASPIYTLFHR